MSQQDKKCKKNDAHFSFQMTFYTWETPMENILWHWLWKIFSLLRVSQMKLLQMAVYIYLPPQKQQFTVCRSKDQKRTKFLEKSYSTATVSKEITQTPLAKGIQLSTQYCVCHVQWHPVQIKFDQTVGIDKVSPKFFSLYQENIISGWNTYTTYHQITWNFLLSIKINKKPEIWR